MAPRLGVDPLDAATQLAGNVAVLVTALNCLTLVIVLFTLGQAEFTLGAAVLQVDLKRDQGLVAVAHLPHEFVYLPAVQEQLARALGRVIRPRSLGVLRDVEIGCRPRRRQ